MNPYLRFLIGISASSVALVITANPLPEHVGWLLLGGISALLPAMLSKGVAWFLRTPDMDIVPDPLDPDAKLIADALDYALDHVAQHRQPLTIRLHPVPLGQDVWLPYELRFQPLTSSLSVAFEPPQIYTCFVRVAERLQPTTSESPKIFQSLPQPIGLRSRSRMLVGSKGPIDLTLSPSAEGRVYITERDPLTSLLYHPFAGILPAVVAAPFGGWHVGLIVLIAYALSAWLDKTLTTREAHWVTAVISLAAIHVCFAIHHEQQPLASLSSRAFIYLVLTVSAALYMTLTHIRKRNDSH